MVSLFIFPTGPTALDSEPRGRWYVKNMEHNRNRLYSRAIPVVYHIFDVSSSMGLGIEGYRTCSKDELDFAFLSLGGPCHGARVWCLGRVPKHRNQWQEIEGLLFSPKKLSVGAYFELLFLGCGFLIHFSNRSDSPQFWAPWKKIRQKYGTLQEPPLFKGHPLSC